MLKGNVTSAYGVTLDKNFRKVVTEFRQCTHCQTSWPYMPGSGNKYGMCLYCYGLLCKKCVAIKWKQVSDKCVPFSEGVAANTKGWRLDENLGIFLRG